MNLKDNKMSREQLEAKLNSLHTKETKWKVLAVCAGVMMFVIGFITGNVLLVLAFLVLLIVFCGFWGKCNSEMKSFLSENVINDVLTEMFGDTVEYKPFEQLNPGGIVVPFHYISSKGENHIKGVYNGVSFELGDISLIDEEEYSDGDGGTDIGKVTRMNVAVKNEQELFELQKGKVNVDALHKKFRAELCKFTEIIDILCGRERNV